MALETAPPAGAVVLAHGLRYYLVRSSITVDVREFEGDIALWVTLVRCYDPASDTEQPFLLRDLELVESAWFRVEMKGTGVFWRTCLDASGKYNAVYREYEQATARRDELASLNPGHAYRISIEVV